MRHAIAGPMQGGLRARVGCDMQRRAALGAGRLVGVRSPGQQAAAARHQPAEPLAPRACFELVVTCFMSLVPGAAAAGPVQQRLLPRVRPRQHGVRRLAPARARAGCCRRGLTSVRRRKLARPAGGRRRATSPGVALSLRVARSTRFTRVPARHAQAGARRRVRLRSAMRSRCSLGPRAAAAAAAGARTRHCRVRGFRARRCGARGGRASGAAHPAARWPRDGGCARARARREGPSGAAGRCGRGRRGRAGGGHLGGDVAAIVFRRHRGGALALRARRGGGGWVRLLRVHLRGVRSSRSARKDPGSGTALCAGRHQGRSAPVQGARVEADAACAGPVLGGHAGRAQRAGGAAGARLAEARCRACEALVQAPAGLAAGLADAGQRTGLTSRIVPA